VDNQDEAQTGKDNVCWPSIHSEQPLSYCELNQPSEKFHDRSAYALGTVDFLE
jgi:hypothetical protein